jgi:hypothetical protein
MVTPFEIGYVLLGILILLSSILITIFAATYKRSKDRRFLVLLSIPSLFLIKSLVLLVITFIDSIAGEETITASLLFDIGIVIILLFAVHKK